MNWKSGGWVLLLGLAMVAAVVVWRVGTWVGGEGGAIGDGRDPASYGFDLEGLSPAIGATLVGSGLSRDQMPALDEPPTMDPVELGLFNEAHRGKYLVADDWVVGVTIDGASRAYPLRLLNWHEAINDRLGGRAILVSYHPLCDSVAVYDRSVDGTTRRFGISGLLYDSNVVLFDRESESLWSQITGAAIAGSAAGRALEALPASLARWSDWLAARPDTTIAAPDAAKLKRYQKNPYGGYLLTGKLRFPVDPPPDRERQMEPVLLVGAGPTPMIESETTSIPEARAVEPDPTVDRIGLLLPPDATLPVRYARRFAIEAQLADR